MGLGLDDPNQALGIGSGMTIPQQGQVPPQQEQVQGQAQAQAAPQGPPQPRWRICCHSKTSAVGYTLLPSYGF